MISTPMWAIGEPSGPIENGTTYIVRPAHAAVEQAVERLAHLGGVAPVVGRAGVLLALGADEGAVLDPGHVARDPSARGSSSGAWRRRAARTSRCRRARRQRRSYSSAEPSHQWIASGLVSSAIRSTQAVSAACLVGASAAMLSVTGQVNSLMVCAGPSRGLRCEPSTPGPGRGCFHTPRPRRRVTGARQGRDRHRDASRGGRRCRRRPALITLSEHGQQPARPAIRCDQEIVVPNRGETR